MPDHPEWVRNGTLSLYAALNTRTGEVLGHTAAREWSISRTSPVRRLWENQIAVASPRPRSESVSTGSKGSYGYLLKKVPE